GLVATDVPEKFAEDIAAIRAEHFHFEIVALFDSGRSDVCSVEGSRGAFDRRCRLIIGREDSVIAEPGGAEWRGFPIAEGEPHNRSVFVTFLGVAEEDR